MIIDGDRLFTSGLKLGPAPPFQHPAWQFVASGLRFGHSGLIAATPAAERAYRRGVYRLRNRMSYF